MIPANYSIFYHGEDNDTIRCFKRSDKYNYQITYSMNTRPFNDLQHTSNIIYLGHKIWISVRPKSHIKSTANVIEMLFMWYINGTSEQ